LPDEGRLSIEPAWAAPQSSGKAQIASREFKGITQIVTLRFVLTLHALAVLAQSGFAGEFLSGSDGPVKFHEFTGWLILGICALQLTLAAVLARSGTVSLWLVFGSVFLLLAEALQTGTGYGRFLRVHIPLGVVTFGAVTWQLVSVFRAKGPGAGLRT